MMFFTLIGRAVRLSNLRQAWASTTWATMATLLLIAPLVASAQTAADFEKPPILQAKDLVPATMLTGKGFRVANQVPTDGFMAIFTITTDAGRSAITQEPSRSAAVSCLLSAWQNSPRSPNLKTSVKQRRSSQPWPRLRPGRSSQLGIWCCTL